MSASVATITNPLKALAGYGQSAWLDYVRRSLFTSGELQRHIDEDGLTGVTSNPAIFEKAITGSTDYVQQLESLRGYEGDAKGIYEQVAVQDIQTAADVMLQVYTRTNKRDGYVSLEVSPTLARDTPGTLDEARRLWKWVDRPNVMIKVPATPEGIPAIQTLISEGINVNVTLLFHLSAYETVAEAFIKGIEALVKNGGDPSRVASVASFFISRIDSAIDASLGAKAKAATSLEEKDLITSLTGKVAIANAKLTYQRYKQLFAGPRWAALAAKGAQTQRLLWASTSTKNPNYRDVIYVEELIGADTVDTIPPATFDAFRDHGRLSASLEADATAAKHVMDNLPKVGIDFKQVTDKLLIEGLKLFDDAFVKLLAAIDKSRVEALTAKIDHISYKLPAEMEAKLNAAVDDWQKNGKVRRLWQRDASLWTNSDESSWLGWLGMTDDQLAHIGHLVGIQAEVKHGGFTHVALLGMGGSSLCPEVMQMTFGRQKGFPEFQMLDSTDPQQLRNFEKKLNLKTTLFIVSSKSGATLEPNIFKQYFFERMKQTVGADKAGEHFIAITDPGSSFEKVAQNDHFRQIFHGRASIGGRFSALSDFGMVPSACIGIDMEKLLDTTEEMVHACSPTVPVKDNPGVMLGLIMGTHAVSGKDKLTLVTSPGIADLGAWLEQLLAESSGKEGKGIIPVDREQIGDPSVYGDDRLFVYLRLESAADGAQDAAISKLEAAGKSVVRISVVDIYDVGQEFFRWEIAISVAGSVIGINTFNQPDVEASKIETRNLTKKIEETGSLPPESPFFEGEGIKLFADDKNASRIKGAAKGGALADHIKAHLDSIKAGDYAAVLGYIEMNTANEKALQTTRHSIRDTKKAATCLGFGPRFLHSTGQAYKGGPNSGVFLQVTCDDAEDVPVPGSKYSFGLVKAAQARGDFQVLNTRGRRALRVHLGKDVAAGLKTLHAAVEKALS